MQKMNKRIVSLILSVLMLVSSLSVAFTVSAEETEAELIPMAKLTEDIALKDGDTQIGTVNYYKANAWGASSSYADKALNDMNYVKTLVNEDSELLNFASTPAGYKYTRGNDNTYTAEKNWDGNRIPVNPKTFSNQTIF